MKVIQGKYKGIKLSGFDIKGTRPTMDRVKESLFAMIQNNIDESFVLDLFAGSGNLGIEALSMNAKGVVFVDYNNIAIKTLKENLEKIKEDQLVIKMNYTSALKYFYENNYKFDIIFLDPPYDTNCIEISIKLIDKYNLLEKSGLIVCESNNIEKIKYSNKYVLYKQKRYGEKYIVILKN